MAVWLTSIEPDAGVGAEQHGGHRAPAGGPGQQPDDAVPGGELDEVTPVHADVGERPIRTAFTGLAAPAGGRTAGLPVLQVGAVQQMQRPGLPGSHARPGSRTAG